MAFRTDGSSALADNDPYRGVERSDIRPDFLVDNSSGKQDEGGRFAKIIDFNAARERLRGVEGVAEDVGVNKTEAEEAEETPEISFQTNVAGTNKATKGKFKGFLKKKGPLGFIVALLLGGGGLIIGSQNLMPFSLLEQLRTTYDSISTSNKLRSAKFWSLQLSKKGITNPIAKKYFGFGGDTYKISKKQRARLATQGLYVEDDFGGTGKTVILFDDGSNKFKIIAAGDGDIGTLKNVSPSEISLENDIDMGKFEIDTDDVMSFRTAYDSVADFRNGYINSSRTWRGSVGAWFDSITVRFLQSNKITRNRFRDFQKKVQAEYEGNTRTAAIEIMKDGLVDGAEIGVRSSEVQTEGEGDAEHAKETTVGRYKALDTDSVTTKESIKSGDTNADIKSKLEATGKAAEKSGSSLFGTAANSACAIFNVVGGIQMLIAAQESSQVIRLVTSYLEAIDMVRAGDGANSPIHVLSNGLTTKVDTTREVNADPDDVDSVETKTEVVRKGMTAMQSVAISSMYNNKKINQNDASIQNFNIGERFDDILGRIGAGMTSFTACAIAKLTAAAAGAVKDTADVLFCVATFGVGCVVNKIVESVGNMVVGAGVGLAVNAAIKVIMPLAVTAFTRDLISELAGEDLGNALVMGAAIYMGMNHLSGGGSPATRSKYLAYLEEQQASIAEEAKFQRETLSPFDLNSEYTFFGSLVKQLITLSTMTSAPTNIVSTIGSMTRNSLVAMLPSASAYDIGKNLMTEEEFEQTCPALASVGATGDAFCTPYIISDVETIDVDPEEVVEVVQDHGGLKDDGQIDKSSNLAKYIEYCSGRSSMFGLSDHNIANDFSLDVNTNNQEFNTVSNAVIGAIPIVGDLQDMFTNGAQLANSGWISGQSCVAGNETDTTSFDASINWEEGKYYQRYIEDQRLLESMYNDYKSTVSVYLEEREKEDPVDTSYEGILARKSGMTKETVVALLDYMEYQDMVAKYDPNTRHQFGEQEKASVEIFIEGHDLYNIAFIEVEKIVYFDTRNRVFAVA